MDTNIIIAIASVFIAACALWVTVWQGMETRKHNKNLVRPWLNVSWYENRLDAGGDATRHSEFKISNNGYGLAIVKKVVLFDDGEEISHNNNKIYCDYLLNLLKGFYGVYIEFIMPDAIIKVDEEKILWQLDHHHENDDIDFIHKLDLLIEYQSIYRDETFVLDTRNLLESKI